MVVSKHITLSPHSLSIDFIPGYRVRPHDTLYLPYGRKNRRHRKFWEHVGDLRRH
jgi:hypothetical protein